MQKSTPVTVHESTPGWLAFLIFVGLCSGGLGIVVALAIGLPACLIIALVRMLVSRPKTIAAVTPAPYTFCSPPRDGGPKWSR